MNNKAPNAMYSKEQKRPSDTSNILDLPRRVSGI